jgi:hypothetical protein
MWLEEQCCSIFFNSETLQTLFSALPKVWFHSHAFIYIKLKLPYFIQATVFTEQWWLSSSLQPTDVITMISLYQVPFAWNPCWELTTQTGIVSRLFDVYSCFKQNIDVNNLLLLQVYYCDTGQRTPSSCTKNSRDSTLVPASESTDTGTTLSSKFTHS